MTASGGAGGAGGGRATGRIVLAVVAVLVALIVIGQLTSDRRTDIPYDPTSASPTGTKALTELLEGFGADVSKRSSFPDDRTDIAIMFQDVVPESKVEDLRRWVRDGHTLVVTDPTSELTPEAEATSTPHQNTSPGEIDQGLCTIDALRDAKVLDVGAPSGYGSRFVVDGQAPVCFADDATAFVVETPLGQGRIVSIASGALFMNRYLDDEDNAVLAAQLLAPTPGTRVGILTLDTYAGADDGPAADVGSSVGRLLTPGLSLMVLQLLVALGIYGMARGRRLGRPVAEPQPVQINGSELVAAVGNLLQQTKQPGNAATVLRQDVRTELGRRLGLPPGAAPPLIADTIAARTPIDRDAALHALDDHPITSEAELVALAQQIDTIREEVLHGHAP